ncbi:MAG: HyaD/HybD family hydrogenase maturation endopeptidase [Dehalococcoidales bacterium]|nr:MAG: HyaD/HybD family hydrogenase maturation endopeptidase [Dehalococcoidales bacterium]
MTTITHPAKVIVLGMGNLLLRDEGIGVHVANALQSSPMSVDVNLEVIDGGTLPDAVLSLDTADKLIVVDAVQTGGEPGAIYRFRPEDIDLDEITVTSLHQISLLENLWLMERFGDGPKNVVIIGVEPEDISWGLELSEKIQQRIPQIVRIVLEEINSTSPDGPEKGE